MAFEIDANGITHVSARDLGTGKAQSVEIVPTGGLTATDIEEMISQAQHHAGADRMKKENAELLNMAEALIYSTEKSLVEFSEHLAELDRELIAHDVENLKSALQSKEMARIRKATSNLETSSHRLAEALYAAASGE